MFLQGTGNRVFNNVIHDTDYVTTDAAPVFAGTSESLLMQQLIAYNTIYNTGRVARFTLTQVGAQVASSTTRFTSMVSRQTISDVPTPTLTTEWEVKSLTICAMTVTGCS